MRRDWIRLLGESAFSSHQNGKLPAMQTSDLELLVGMRVVVGFLGEKEQAGWWSSSFLGVGSAAFLAPVFPRTQFLAHCRGVTAAAAKVHDERIGVGQVFHLFRLPEDLEQAIHRILHSSDVIERLRTNVADRDAAKRFLQMGNGKVKDSDVGPTYVAETRLLRDAATWRQVAAKYANAFARETEVYPYFADRK
jgi:hypothetical protein